MLPLCEAVGDSWQFPATIAKAAMFRIANALAAKATHAVADFDAGHYSAAKGVLGAFINQVQAQRGKFITADAADLLVEYATLLLDQLP